MPDLESAEIYIVPEEQEECRLSDLGSGVFDAIPSRAALKKSIKRGEVFVDGKAATTATIIKPGMKLVRRPIEIPPAKIYRMNLEVVFEDDYLAIVFKPGGIVVSGNRFKTLENALPAHLQPSSLSDCLSAPRAVHRLDAPTSGLVLVAKTRKSRMALGEMLQQKTVKKIYTTVVIGDTPEEWENNNDIDGKPSVTRFKKIDKVPSLLSGTLSLVEAQPVTGRTHQIRKHLFQQGYPILGDKQYAFDGFILKRKGLFLCATELEFGHPAENRKLHFKNPPPNKFLRFMQSEKRRYLKYRHD